ncbi:MAG: hypothetical protein ACJ70W_03985 [Nitrososphaera sp.]
MPRVDRIFIHKNQDAIFAADLHGWLSTRYYGAENASFAHALLSVAV